MKKIKYLLNENLVSQKIGKKIVIFSGENSVLFTLNQTGNLIFQGVKLGWDEKKIGDKLVQEYNISAVDAKKDIEKFLESLFEKKILTKK